MNLKIPETILTNDNLSAEQKIQVSTLLQLAEWGEPKTFNAAKLGLVDIEGQLMDLQTKAPNVTVHLQSLNPSEFSVSLQLVIVAKDCDQASLEFEPPIPPPAVDDETPIFTVSPQVFDEMAARYAGHSLRKGAVPGVIDFEEQKWVCRMASITDGELVLTSCLQLGKDHSEPEITFKHDKKKYGIFADCAVLVVRRAASVDDVIDEAS